MPDTPLHSALTYTTHVSGLSMLKERIEIYLNREQIVNDLSAVLQHALGRNNADHPSMHCGNDGQVNNLSPDGPEDRISV